MSCTQNADKIRVATQKILNCGDAFGIMYEAVHEMYEVYASISGIGIQNQNRKSIFLDSGKAISTPEAAHCLLEMVRTTKFLRGIKDAFDAKIQSSTTNLPISVLYAGTGPYATLVTPLLLLYSPVQLQVDLIDINEESLQSAIRVIADLGLGQFVRTTMIDDAAKMKLNSVYDVVISETMQAALKKEHQVAIMQNLIPQCSANTIFIPQEITVNAELVSKEKWNSETYAFDSVNHIELGEVVRVNNETLNHIGQKKVFAIATNNSNCKTLILTTNITVFGNHRLENSDCSLTMPFKMNNVADNQSEHVSFWYEQGKVPGLSFNFSNTKEIYYATGRKNY